MGIYDNEGKFDFYDIKGIVEQLLKRCGAPEYDVYAPDAGCSFGEVSAFHPGRCAVISINGTEVAIFGELHPETLENYGIGCRAYAAKVNIPELMAVCSDEKHYKPLPKYPATLRDISLLCDDKLPAAVIEKTIKKAAGAILEKVTLFDIYKGKQIAEGKKSISYSLTLRSHDGTLTDDQADKTMEKVIKALAEQGAELRM